VAITDRIPNSKATVGVTRRISEIAVGVPVAVDIELGSNPTSLIIRLSNELRDAQASLRRAVIVARALAAMPSNKEYCDHGR
jgi:hypothetical protein